MIKLNLDVETPMSEDDRDILAGISVMMLAIANRQDLAQQMEQRNAEGIEEGEEELGELVPCGLLNAKGESCVKEVGHVGRHKHRPFDFSGLTPRSLN